MRMRKRKPVSRAHSRYDRARSGRSQRAVGVGEVATIPIGVAHRWWNVGEGKAVVRVALRPALDTETFFEVLFGLSRDGKTNRKGIPGLLQIAVTVSALGDSCSTLVMFPAAVQRFVFALLAPIGRRCPTRTTTRATRVCRSSWPIPVRHAPVPTGSAIPQVGWV
jgi:hypothetical protein